MIKMIPYKQNTRSEMVFMFSIIHVDMNAFYASCHQAANPALKSKPVMVAGDPKNRSGIILTASYEARKFGVKTGMPNWQAKRLCPNGVFIKPDHELYAAVSKKVMQILGRFTPQLEVFSIDEAWLDVTGCEKLFGDSVTIGKKIQDSIADELDITCSVGISCNKLLAKMASDMKKPAGLTVIRPEDVPHLLWPLPVKRLFGVGRKMARKLERLNINTIGELANAPEELLKDKFGLNGCYLHLAANGIDESPVDPHANDEAKSMGHSITLPQDVTSWGKAEAVLLNLSEKVGRRIRREDYMGRTVSIALRDNHFTTITRSKTIPYTSSTEDIYAAAKSLLHKNWDGKIPLRLLGVSVSQLVKEFEQISLFDDNERKRKINKVVDDIKDRFGEKAIYRAKSQM